MVGITIFVFAAVTLVLCTSVFGQDEYLIRTLKAHSSWGSSFAFNPNNSSIAWAGIDSTIKLTDIASGRLLKTFIGHKSVAAYIAFNPDGTILASTGKDDKKLIIWDVSSGSILITLKINKDQRKIEAFTEDGSKIIISDNLQKGIDSRKIAIVFDLFSGKKIRAFEGYSLALSSDGHKIAIMQDGDRYNQRVLRFWDVSSGDCLAGRAGFGEHVRICAFSPKAGKIAIQSYDNESYQQGSYSSYKSTISIYDSFCRILSVLSQQLHFDKVIFTPDDTMLVTSDRDIKLWDVDNGRLLSNLSDIYEISSFDISPDGLYLAKACLKRNDSWEQTRRYVEVWDIIGNQSLNAFDTELGDVIFSPNSSYLATVGYGSISIWDFTKIVADGERRVHEEEGRRREEKRKKQEEIELANEEKERKIIETQEQYRDRYYKDLKYYKNSNMGYEGSLHLNDGYGRSYADIYVRVFAENRKITHILLNLHNKSFSEYLNILAFAPMIEFRENPAKRIPMALCLPRELNLPRELSVEKLYNLTYVEPGDQAEYLFHFDDADCRPYPCDHYSSIYSISEIIKGEARLVIQVNGVLFSIDDLKKYGE